MARKPVRIDTFQRGGDRSALPALEGAARFYLGRLASTRLLNTLDIRIECRAGVRVVDERPSAFSLDEPAALGPSPKRFTITLRRDDPIRAKLIALAHECVGVTQRAHGTLRVLRDGSIRWHADDYTGTDWRCWPWLAERYSLGSQLHLALKLAVLDGKLDLGAYIPTLD